MTLVEIIVTMALAAILTLAVFSAVTGSALARKVNRQNELARETCRAWLDHISDLANQNIDPSSLHDTYYDVPLTTGGNGPVVPAAMTDPSLILRGPLAAPDLGKPLHVAVVELAPPGGGAPPPFPLWRVTITVTWLGSEKGFGTQEFIMSTVVTNRRGQ